MATFIAYFGTCLLISASVSCAGLGLWSNLGCGITCLHNLSGQWTLALGSAGVVLLCVLLLYLLDFFAPPHLPGTYFTLDRGAKCVEHAVLFAIAVGCFVLCCFSVEIVPTLPLLATILLCPASIGLAYSRLVTSTATSLNMTEDLAFEVRMALLRLYASEEKQQLVFHKAACFALALTAVGCFAVWIVWLFENGFHGNPEKELDFAAWVAPLLVALSNLMFGSFIGLRILMNNHYRATNEQKNRLLVEHIGNCSQSETIQHQKTLMRARLTQVSRGLSRKQVMEMSEEKVHQYLTQHVTGMEQLALVIKMIGCAFVGMLMAILVVLRLVSEVVRTKVLMALSIFGAFFLVFVMFVSFSFHRLWQAMNLWITELPIWASLRATLQASWARATVILLTLPVSPFLFVLCVLNQTVRRCRGLGTLPAARQTTEAGVKVPATDGGSVRFVLEEFESCTAPALQGPRCLTQRARNLLFDMQSWDWVSIIRWWYILGLVMFVLKITPVFLNPLLAWIGSLLKEVGFLKLLVIIYLLGMFLFMLPPVPGPTVYAFAGIVIAKKSEEHFWSGAVVCILLSFFLKLTACTVQQKCIGELFGSSLWVRKNVGVHKPFIRAIGMILGKPGISRDKCMILCGGPDWPTSVLAGIMRISLMQCLKGTCPVLASLIPLCLMGSLTARKDEEMYSKLSELMLLLSGIVSAGFWVGMAWAVQDAFDKHYGELTAPKREFLELDWLDYRSEYIAKRVAVTWGDVPALLRFFYAGGAFSLTFVVHVVLWRTALCFTTVDVSANFDELELVWYGRDGLVRRPMGAAVLIAVAVCSLGLVVFGCWIRCTSKARFTKAEEEVSSMESSWKDERMMVIKSDKSSLSCNSHFFWFAADNEIATEGHVLKDATDARDINAAETFNHKFIDPELIPRVKQHHGMDTE